MEPQHERREALLELVHAVSATVDPRKIADAIVERVSTWIAAPCWTLLAADASGRASVLSTKGLTPEIQPTVLRLAERVMSRGAGGLVTDLESLDRVTDRAGAAAIAFPLVCRGARIGVLIGYDAAGAREIPRASSALRTLAELIEPAAATLHNALLLERAEALSVTDDLTQLYNSRYLNQVLRRETKRASRSGRPLSLLFVDLDGFKQVNDTHGHLFGSRALVEAAALIRTSARETDVVARFGGDEFALVLPETGSDGAQAVAERVRERVASHHFLEGDGLDVHLTASIGIATLPQAAGSAEELVQAADRAMYQVKDSGKNGIQTAAARADN
jgi:diguanylate cyclase (GGDEF)-like protein